jgi:hypothetical protein
MVRIVLLLQLYACQSDGPKTIRTKDTSAPVGPSDTGDSGELIAPPAFSVSGAEATVQDTPGPTCAEPHLRDEQPFLNDVGTGDWQDQWVPWEDLTAGRGWGLAVADFNGDDILDVFLPNIGFDEMFIGDGAGGFTRDEAAIPMSLRDDDDLDTTGTAATDIDGDGDVDLYLANRGPDRLLLNRGDGTFEDISETSGIGAEDFDSISASWGHLDDDGRPDLFVSTYKMGIFPFEDLSAGITPQGDPNRLYRNLGDGRFEDISASLPEAAQSSFAFAAGWHDLDRDGDADLVIVNDLGPIVQPNQVLRNDGGVLVDMSEDTSLDLPMYGMGLGVGDVNGDLFPDFLFSSWDDLVWMESDGAGDWYENSLNRGLTSTWSDQHVGWGAELADLDNDQRLDALVPFGALIMDEFERSFFALSLDLVNPDEQSDMAFIGTADGFESRGARWGLDSSAMSRVLLPADLNADGWLDLVGRSLDQPAALHLAQCGTSGWLQIRVVDQSPNTLGLGVRIDATLYGVDGEVAQQATRTIQAGSTGIASSGPHRAQFGLGDAVWVTLDIHWLDGEVTRIEGVTPDQFLLITRS